MKTIKIVGVHTAEEMHADVIRLVREHGMVEEATFRDIGEVEPEADVTVVREQIEGPAADGVIELTDQSSQRGPDKQLAETGHVTEQLEADVHKKGANP